MLSRGFRDSEAFRSISGDLSCVPGRGVPESFRAVPGDFCGVAGVPVAFQGCLEALQGVS